ncbi:hypothetical protein GCM10022234_00160 [Aeromicrobium panaciterrae]|uniref:DUF5403 family protein n=1 Tax=Aeromicrobium panaciterrae TaxID=363861 RepID=UPI0031CE285C
MALIYEKVNGVDLHDYIAHMPGVKDAVNEKGRETQHVAEAIFAKHDRPGGHQITGGPDGITDYYVYLEGPVPHIIEYGRAAYVTKKAQRLGDRIIPAGTHVGAWDGTHVLRRTWEAM